MSTLNSKLKQVAASTIKLMTSAGKNMSLTAGTAEGGAISSNLYVGFKQPSKAKTADPYQIQYKVRYIYTAANRKSKGATYSATWGSMSWRNAVQFTKSGTVRKIGVKETTFAANKWECANKGVNTAGDYATFMNLKGTRIASGYVAAQYIFRIRTYNKKTNKHGSWVTSQTLTIRKAATMIDEVLHRDVDGSLFFDMNYAWDTGGKFYVEKILDSSSRDILVAPYSGALATDTDRTATTNPPKKANYTAGEFRIPIEKLKRGVEYGEYLYITAYFETSAGKVKTYWKNKAGAKCQVSRQTLSLTKPEVSLTYSKATGIITAKMWKGLESDHVSGASFTASYEWKGKKYTCQPIKKTGDVATMTSRTATDAKSITAYYMVPLNTPITFKATLESSYHSQTADNEKTVMQEYGPAWLMNKMSSWSSTVGMIFKNVEFNDGTSPAVSIEEVYKRDNPFVVYGASKSTSLTLDGDVTDWPDVMIPGTKLTTNKANVDAWRKIKNNPGIYCLRSPDGLMYNVAVTNVTLKQTRPDMASVSVTMTEAS